MEPAPYIGQNRQALTKRLQLLNQALDRLGVPPLVTVEESQALPVDNLRGVVAATADRVETVSRTMRGIS